MWNLLKSTCGAQSWVQTHRIHPSRSTSAGRYSKTKGLNHQSTQSTCLRWCNHFDLHCGRSERCELLCHALTNALEHGRATRQHHIGIQVFADVHIALHDGLEGRVVDATCFFADETGLEENLRTTEALAAHCDDVSIWQLVSLLFVRALGCQFHFAVIIQRNVRELLLDVTHDLALRCGCESPC